MRLARWILRRAGWSFKVNLPEPLPPRCVLCVAPHTSNWDFVLGELGIRSVGMHSGFMMKDTWFFFPLGPILRSMGGVPVKQHRSTHVSEHMVNTFGARKRLWIAITPEGTRSPNPNWHKGMLHIARDAGVPLVLAYFDYKRREMCIDRYFDMSDDPDADIVRIKHYYQGRAARYPEKFVTGLEAEPIATSAPQHD